jgi:hypothetical protein
VWCCPECYSITSKGLVCAYHPDSTSIHFHSKGEFNYWLKLLQWEKAGAITDLQRQVPFKLDVNGVKIATYTCDFAYMDQGVYKVIDFKGMDTYSSKLLRKLTKAIHGIDVELAH